MRLLLDGPPGTETLLLGNEAIVRGAFEAGVEVVTAYPGTPSSEIPDTIFPLSRQSDLYFEYSTNEKVALEVAAGAAIAGMRALTTMKHVGLNVAADPLCTLAYTGVKAGMVILTADDPSMHSSQNEQDNRYYAKLAIVPMIEPSDAAEGLAFTRAAFALSERLGMPVLLRTTTRMNHCRGVVRFGEMLPRRFQGHFDKNIMRWVPVPMVAQKLRMRVLEKEAEARTFMRELGIDRIEGDGDLGIVTSGVSFLYVKEVVDELGLADRVRIAKISSIYPFPEHVAEEMLRACKKILVVEELEPYVENEVRVVAQKTGSRAEIFGKGEGFIPRHYELNPDRVRPAVGRLAGVEVKVVAPAPIPPLPARPPMLCAGCTHRSTYYAVKSVADADTYFASDIGCYTLGLLPPLSTTDSFLCMGSSVTMASGVTIRNPQRHVAFIGDSTFFHGGMTGVVNAVHNNHDLLLVILDNSTTAMTGHQPHPTSELGKGAMTPVDLERVVRGLGVDDVTVVDPNDLDAAIGAVRNAYFRKGVRVIISRHACPLFEKRILKLKGEERVYTVDHDRCKFCGSHREHQPCGVPILADDEILRARAKITTAGLAPMAYPAEGAARKQKTAPCAFTCPANICVFGYVGLVRAGRFREALALIREQVPLPVSLGRVCHHPCEARCVRGDFEGPIAINDLKRFVAEAETEAERAAHFDALRKKAAERPSKERVAVVGGGPAGLAAAHELAVRGYPVTIFEREATLGGLLATGIPDYRMPRDLLAAEIGAILSLGIEAKTNAVLGRDFTARGLLEGGYAAVVLALGAAKGARLAIEGEALEGVEDALGFLRRVYVGSRKDVGRRVLVVGGGDAAIDAARTARRLGAQAVKILYRRDEKEMPASREEIAAALAEGIEIVPRCVPVAIRGAGRVSAAVCVRTEPGPIDGSSRRKPIPVAGSEHEIEADHVVVAVGQLPDTTALGGDAEIGAVDAGAIPADRETGATAHPAIFAAGDVTGEGWTVIEAIASGKRAAYGVDKMLRGAAAAPHVRHKLSELEDQARFHPAAVPAAERVRPAERPGAERARDFEPIAATFDAAQAVAEAERCLSCGQCARCNNCIDNFGCPAIYKKDGRIYIDDVLCVGCGVCAQLCPNDAIVPVAPAKGRAG